MFDDLCRRGSLCSAAVIAVASLAACGAESAPVAVAYHAPVAGQADVSIDAKVRVHFLHPMDLTSMTQDAFTLVFDGQRVEGDVISTPTTAEFEPYRPLEPRKIYTATVTTTARYADGSAPANAYVWRFTTAAILRTPTRTIDVLSPLDADHRAADPSQATRARAGPVLQLVPPPAKP